ncbi:MAG: ferrochelatase [Acidobacteria bacterium]|nr:ferrochelatase [Acidobacteriota bacterium]
MPTGSVLMIAFGGPEKSEDIVPYLRRVTKGRQIPEERLQGVAEHYERLGGKSPLNELTFRQAKLLEERLEAEGRPVPVFVGMRNWHPFLAETLRKMNDQGHRTTVGIIMAAHQCGASWEQYQRDVEEAVKQEQITIKIAYPDPVFDHPGFIEATAEQVRICFKKIPADLRNGTMILFTAHSVPTQDPHLARYVNQLQQSCRRVAAALQHPRWNLCYQSRSGKPQDPWLEPDVNEAIQTLASRDVKTIVVVPIGFLCDHVEVLHDLDTEARKTAIDAGIQFLRARTVSDDPRFIEALAERVLDHLQ